VKTQGVVIAFDGRLSSRTFAEDAAAILAGQGIPVHIFPDPQPTPVCAFAVADLKAAAGIMVTASHNPPADNGYKVYWANAAQIIPPVEGGITDAIARAPLAHTITRIAAPDAFAAGLRHLIGDDEHGWTNTGVFNFEGGCYAKTIDLTEEKEPEIFHAIRPGALVENITFHPDTTQIDFGSRAITENTRVSYPLHFISNARIPSVGELPKHIFFLTCDAYGILPPVSKLTPAQAMYQFISGYTARVAGPEAGVTEPKATFSACFGAPFLPLHPGKYAEMLGQKLREHNVDVWLINTGWSGGPYGVGQRMKLGYTRAMITAVLNGTLQDVPRTSHPVFGMEMPLSCPGVPNEILNPRNTWADGAHYDAKALELGAMFRKNFEKYASGVSAEILAAAPIG
jgi:phosphoenolpyruvate carboxykinase (ATP)